MKSGRGYLASRTPTVRRIHGGDRTALEHAKEALQAGVLDVLAKPKPDPAIEAEAAHKIADKFADYCDWKPPQFLAGWMQNLGFSANRFPRGIDVKSRHALHLQSDIAQV